MIRYLLALCLLPALTLADSVRAKLTLQSKQQLTVDLIGRDSDGMVLTRDSRAAQATERQLSPLEFLALLLDDELERRGQQRLAQHLKLSGCDAAKTLAHFDFSAAPAINRGFIQDLASCTFIQRHQNLLGAQGCPETTFTGIEIGRRDQPMQEQIAEPGEACVHGDRVVDPGPEQSGDRHPLPLRHEVPEPDVDTADGSGHHSLVSVLDGGAHHRLPDGLDVGQIGRAHV